METILRAYHGKKSIKNKYLARMRAHIKADELVAGIGFDKKNHKGCFVGCTLDNYSHVGFETELGIPREIAWDADNIFERIQKEERAQFSVDFHLSIKVGASLKWVFWDFSAILLGDKEKGAVAFLKDEKQKEVRKLIEECTELFKNHTPATNEAWKKMWASLARLDSLASLARLASLDSLARLDSLASLARLASLDSLDSLARLASLDSLDSLDSYKAHFTWMKDQFLKVLKSAK